MSVVTQLRWIWCGKNVVWNYWLDLSNCCNLTPIDMGFHLHTCHNHRRCFLWYSETDPHPKSRNQCQFQSAPSLHFVPCCKRTCPCRRNYLGSMPSHRLKVSLKAVCSRKCKQYVSCIFGRALPQRNHDCPLTSRYLETHAYSCKKARNFISASKRELGGCAYAQGWEERSLK